MVLQNLILTWKAWVFQELPVAILWCQFDKVEFLVKSKIKKQGFKVFNAVFLFFFKVILEILGEACKIKKEDRVLSALRANCE